MVAQKTVHAGSHKFGLVNVPPVLYKFFDNAEYADAFVSRGSVRIGTLYDFRRVESHDPMRADGGEGRFDYVHRSAFPELITSENAPPPLRLYIEQTGIPIASHGGTITMQGSHPDCYVFCSSHSSAAGSVGYGSHGVRIADPPGFFASLTLHLSRIRPLLKSVHGYAAPCIYRDRSMVTRNIEAFQEVPMAFVKPTTKIDEREVRAVWHPAIQPIEPFITICAKLRPFLSRI